jgi:hypothetical protein
MNPLLSEVSWIVSQMLGCTHDRPEDRTTDFESLRHREARSRARGLLAIEPVLEMLIRAEECDVRVVRCGRTVGLHSGV